MLAVTLNPGFVLIAAAFLVLALPMIARAPVMIAASLAAMLLLLTPERFGAAAAVGQMGLAVVPFALDALNQVFGIAFIAAAILISLHASARRNRYEDAAIMLLAGAAVTALFVGDLVSLIAAATLAGLAGAWVVFASPLANASTAGVRLLVWHGIEGLLLLAGVAFHLSSNTDNSILAHLRVTDLSGGLIFAGFMIRVGGPLAHVWLKDVVSHASGAGGAALSAFSTMLGVYALARLFGAEPLLTPIGAAMILIGIVYAAAEDDLRRAAAYAQTAQTGVCLALVGIGSPLALAGASAHAFTLILAFVLLQMVLGAIVARLGEARASSAQGIARAMPISGMLLFCAGAAIAGAPGSAVYASTAVALEAVGQWETRWVWTLVGVTSAALFAAFAMRATLAVYLQPSPQRRFQEAPFAMLLACIIGLFLCVAVGIAPSWLYRLMPSDLGFAPFALDRLAPQFELLGVAGVGYLVLRAFGLAPKPRAQTLLDVDSLYRGPVAGAGRWLGVVLLRLYGAWREALEWLWRQLARAIGRWAASWDQPYQSRHAALQFTAICALLIIIMFVHV